MESQVLAPLQAIEASLTSLIASLTTTNTFSNAPTAAKDLVKADDALTSALHTLQQHQQNYARILHLRAEAERLEEHIKSVVRTCVDLKSEIGAIHPNILTRSYGEEEEEPPLGSGKRPKRKIAARQEVDYATLLNFAARIGKHNSVAVLEAERESTRRKVEAAKKRKEDTNTNGDTVISPTDGTDTMNANATVESRAEVSQLEDAVAAQRAQLGMAFPAGEILRNGALGRLQYIRERDGEDAVEREVERLVRDSEIVAGPAADETADTQMEETRLEVGRESQAESSKPSQQRQQSLPQAEKQRRASKSEAAAPVRRKLDLDFPGSDDEDDDDE